MTISTEIIIKPWMLNELFLTGDELLAYSVIWTNSKVNKVPVTLIDDISKILGIPTKKTVYLVNRLARRKLLTFFDADKVGLSEIPSKLFPLKDRIKYFKLRECDMTLTARQRGYAAARLKKLMEQSEEN